LEILQHLNINMRTFLKKYARKDRTGYILRDHPGPLKECIFLENNRCIVHAVKPQQCRDFPRKWHDREMLNNCEGMKAAWMQLMAEDASKW
jgi:Fe-S-cluster containining protein